MSIEGLCSTQTAANSKTRRAAVGSLRLHITQASEFGQRSRPEAALPQGVSPRECSSSRRATAVGAQTFLAQ